MLRIILLKLVVFIAVLWSATVSAEELTEADRLNLAQLRDYNPDTIDGADQLVGALSVADSVSGNLHAESNEFDDLYVTEFVVEGRSDQEPSDSLAWQAAPQPRNVNLLQPASLPVIAGVTPPARGRQGSSEVVSDEIIMTALVEPSSDYSVITDAYPHRDDKEGSGEQHGDDNQHGSHNTVHHGGHHGGPMQMDGSVEPVSFDAALFGPDPQYPELEYDPKAQIEIYGGKSAVDTPRPLVELWRPLYDRGNLGSGIPLIGEKNRLFPQLLVYGDARTAVAYNDDQGSDVAQVAARLNLDVDLKLTATERIHAFFQPIQEGLNFTRYEFGGGNRDETADPAIETSIDPVTLFFEGDLGAILAGFTDTYKPYDLPITFGRVPMLLQNGIWMEDAFLGAAFAIPARNSQRFDISNYDITFFAGLDEITSDAFVNDNGKRGDHEARMAGVVGFFEFDEGYLEAGYAYLNDGDHSNGDHSYHNITAAFTKRYFGKISNSTRVIINTGQDPGPGFEDTADGVLFLSENSLITSKPLTFVPYANFWAGFGKTQSVARAGAAEDILRNTGLTFESDGLTGYPTLDATGIDTVGGAIGVQNLFSLEQQLVMEVSAVVPHGDKQGPAKDVQLGAGIRYQRPLTNAVIFRADAMYGHFGDDRDPSTGIRFELRRKF
ncbi:MAG: hypothetical protein MRY72_04950 [Aquisalinus sp.]|nr:hypothetical protein [Aquisalinus sp.]